MRRVLALVLLFTLALLGAVAWQAIVPKRSPTAVAAPSAAPRFTGEEESRPLLEEAEGARVLRRGDEQVPAMRHMQAEERPIGERDSKAPPGGPSGIRGVVVSRDPTIVPPYELRLVPEEEVGTWRSRERDSRTDDQGRFEFERVPPGGWQVEVRAAPPVAPDSEKGGIAGFLSGLFTVEVETWTPPLAVEDCRLSPGERLFVEIPVGLTPSEGCHVFGVLDGMDPTGDVEYQVELYVHPGGPLSTAKATPDAAGAFDLGWVRPGMVNLWVRCVAEGDAGLGASIAHRAFELSEGEERSVRIELPIVCSVEFTLTDRVRSTQIREGELSWRWLGDGSSAGVVRSPMAEKQLIPEGEHVALARAPGYRAVLQPFEVSPHVPSTLVRIEMDRAPPRTRATLVDRDGQPIAHASLVVRELGGFELPNMPMLSTRTDEEGGLDLATLPPGRCLAQLLVAGDPLPPEDGDDTRSQASHGWGMEVTRYETLLNVEVQMDLSGFPAVLQVDVSQDGKD